MRRLMNLLCVSLIGASAGALGDAGHGHETAPATGVSGSAANVSRTVDVTMTEYGYEPSSISVNVDETVRFVVENRGQLVHEFNIGTPKMHGAHQAEMLEMMQSGSMSQTEIHGRGEMVHDHANSVLLEPGERAELVWRFGKDIENLEFACNVPGHYQAGMVGEFKRE